MTKTMSYSATLILHEEAGVRQILCRSCMAPVATADAAWKEHAVLEEMPLCEAGGPYATAGGDVHLRRFYCKSCGTLLDSEVALPGEPFLADRVEA